MDTLFVVNKLKVLGVVPLTGHLFTQGIQRLDGFR